jgi:hypothetical protein
MVKNIYKHLVIAVMTIMAGKASAAGGPDAYGYTWKTSLDAGGPAYSWIDITTKPGVQTVTGLADDNSAASMINIGFSFHYYWSDYTQMKVGSNGWVAFNNVSNIASCFPTIPTPGGAGDNYLAMLMSDLNFTGTGNPGNVKYWSNNIDTFIVSYSTVPYWTVSAPGWAGPNTFQVILAKSDSSITYQYGSLSPLPANAACVDMTVGIENSTGGIGLQVFSDVAPSSNFAIKFDYPATVLLSIQDPITQWNANAENKAVFIPNNTPYAITSNFKNSGNTDVTTTILLQSNVVNSASAYVYTGSGSLPSLDAGEDTTYTFASTWTPTVTGQYSFGASLSNSQDINPGNNSNTTELDVVDICASTMLLNYVTAGAPTGSLNWNGGANDDGAAVYFLPPVYPYSVSQLQYYISSNVSDGYIAQVYDDNGPGGAPGTLLFTQTVAAGSVVTANWNTVTLASPVTLTSGGFYVAWMQGGTTIFLGTETNGPRSHQNYEILDGGWATYREDANRDIYIRATINNFSGVPVTSFSNTTTALNAAFSNTSYAPGTLTTAWNFGDGNTSSSSNPSHTFTASGTYNVCLTVTNTCGSNMSCQLVSVCGPTASTISPVVCDTYTSPGGIVMTSSGTFNDTIMNVAGCDSVITINLTVKNSTASTLTITSCDSYTSPSGMNVTSSGTFNDTISNTAGCDSVITINLTIINSTASTISPVSCDIYFSPGGVSYSSSGIYTDVIPNAAGCDSVITINLTVNNSSASTISPTACDSYTSPSGMMVTSSGTFNDTIANAAGCDSVITINLTIITVDTSVVQTGAMLTSNATGASYQWIDCGTGTMISGETNQSFTATANGNYAVVVTVGACSDTSMCYNVVTTGIENVSSVSLSIYPNPNAGSFTISGLAGEYSIINSLGQRVKMIELNAGNSNTVLIDDLNKGVYYIISNERQVIQSKIVVLK